MLNPLFSLGPSFNPLCQGGPWQGNIIASLMIFDKYNFEKPSLLLLKVADVSQSENDAAVSLGWKCHCFDFPDSKGVD